MKEKIIFILLIFLFLVTSGFGCQQKYSPILQEKSKPVTLNYWRVWDGPDAMEEIIKDYNALHPQINIRYKKLAYNEYEQALLEAFATDKGPDIFSIHNTWMKKYQSKNFLSTMPVETEMVYTEIKAGIKQEAIQTLIKTKMPTLKDIENKFADIVYKDVVINNLNKEKQAYIKQIFGLPLALDTLVMYYNKDLLNNAGITSPPLYWNRQFQQDVKKLTKQDTRGQIIQAGAALGGSANIDRFGDIMAVLMMQNGTTMINDNGKVMFQSIPDNFPNKNYNPGLEALRFYSDFANPGKEVYTWNNDMDNSVNMFASGKLALMFGYAYHLPQIKAKNQKLNINIAKLPQIEGNDVSVNMANYWVETVAKKSKHQNEAWDFLAFAAVNENQVKKYLAITKKPAALRSLINKQIEDSEIGVFAEQVLTSKSWYRGNNAQAAEKAMGEMAEMALAKQEELESVLSYGANRVQQTINEGED
jgi:multiple sugar transport system substrate-binding protein